MSSIALCKYGLQITKLAAATSGEHASSGMPDQHTACAATQGTPLMILITGPFRDTSNHINLYEITLFPTGSLAYNGVYESTESL